MIIENSLHQQVLSKHVYVNNTFQYDKNVIINFKSKQHIQYSYCQNVLMRNGGCINPPISH